MNSSLVRAALAAFFACGVALAAAQEKKETIRPEVGKALQAAQELVKAQKGREALAKVAEADAVAGKTPFETYLVERVRASAALAANDVPAAIRALEAVIASGRLTPPEQLQMVQALGSAYYSQKDYARAIEWTARYFKEGGNDPRSRQMLIQAYYQRGDYANAAQELLADLHEAERAGTPPPEERLRLLANSYLKMDDSTRYRFALEKLVTYYPKKEYWAELIQRTQRSPTFADRFALDILRLRLPTGNVEGAEDYLELAQSALQAGYPAEAKKALDKGYETGALGTGPNADRHRRMRDMVEKQLAEDRRSLEGNDLEVAAESQKDGGLALVNLGFAYVVNGQYDRGLALMERGMSKGTGAIANRKAQDSRLHLGIAYLMAGRKDKALEAFKSISGTHGAADLGRLWAIHARQP
jgi:tetratricopeptide (TPR) repeat protein